MGLGLSGMGHSLGPQDWVAFNGVHVGCNGLCSLICFPLTASLDTPQPNSHSRVVNITTVGF